MAGHNSDMRAARRDPAGSRDARVLHRLIYKNAAQHRAQRHLGLLKKTLRRRAALCDHPLWHGHGPVAEAHLQSYLAAARAWMALLVQAASGLLRVMAVGHFVPLALTALSCLARLRAIEMKILEHAQLLLDQLRAEEDVGVALVEPEQMSRNATAGGRAVIAPARARRASTPTAAPLSAPWNASPTPTPSTAPPKPRVKRKHARGTEIDDIFSQIR